MDKAVRITPTWDHGLRGLQAGDDVGWHASAAAASFICSLMNPERCAVAHDHAACTHKTLRPEA